MHRHLCRESGFACIWCRYVQWTIEHCTSCNGDIVTLHEFPKLKIPFHNYSSYNMSHSINRLIIGLHLYTSVGEYIIGLIWIECLCRTNSHGMDLLFIHSTFLATCALLSIHTGCAVYYVCATHIYVCVIITTWSSVIITVDRVEPEWVGSQVFLFW